MSLHTILFVRLSAVFVLFTLARVSYYFINFSAFSALSTSEVLYAFIGGLRFDCAGTFITHLPYLTLALLPFRFTAHRYYQRFTDAVFLVFSTLAFFFAYVDAGYYPFTGRRLTFDLFKTQGIVQDNLAVLPEYLRSYGYLLIFILGSVAVLAYVVRRTHARHSIQPAWRFYAYGFSLALLCIGLTVVAVRGGLQSRPIKISHAALYVPAPQYAPLVLNTPFSIWASANSSTLERVAYMAPETAERYFSPVQHFDSQGTFKPLNIVIIILESFSAEYVGALNPHLAPDYTGYTPFLDSLIQGAYAPTSFANGSTSIHGISSILSGLPSLMSDAYNQSPYANNRTRSLAQALKPMGYTSAFFHGGRNGTMCFDTFTKAAGFEHYFGMDEYPNPEDFDGCWGISDGPYLQYCARTLSKFQEPFVGVVFTLSSHSPFTIPEPWASTLPEGTLPIHKAIRYTDAMLQAFFETARTQPWYPNTLFVLTADHTSTAYYPEYQQPHNAHRIPIVYYHPHHPLKEHASRPISQQADILPSVLDILNFQGSTRCFGQSVFNPAYEPFAIWYENGLYHLRTRDHLLIHTGQSTHAFYTFDPNVSSAIADIQAELENQLKAIIQQYNTMLIDDL